jgi:hypothetical protein
MPTQAKPSGDDEPTEDLETKGATFKIDGPDGDELQIILPPLKPKD